MEHRPRRRRGRSPQAKIRLANPHKMHSQLVAAHNSYEYVPDPAASGARAARKAASTTNRFDQMNLHSMYHNPHVRIHTLDVQIHTYLGRGTRALQLPSSLETDYALRGVCNETSSCFVAPMPPSPLTPPHRARPTGVRTATLVVLRQPADAPECHLPR